MIAGAINVHSPAIATLQLIPAFSRPVADTNASTAMMIPSATSSVMTGPVVRENAKPAAISHTPIRKLIQLKTLIVPYLDRPDQVSSATGDPMSSFLELVVGSTGYPVSVSPSDVEPRGAQHGLCGVKRRFGLLQCRTAMALQSIQPGEAHS